MRTILLSSIGLVLFGCAGIETAPTTTLNEAPSAAPAAKATIKPVVVLKAVTPNVKLSPKQRKYLDESLPPDIRSVLERSTSFEVYAEINKDERSETDTRTFEANVISVITTETQKKTILEALYHDAAREDSPAACYEPHHSIRATFEGKTIEVEICFDCAQFVVKGTELRGTIVREDRKLEDLLTRFIRDSAIDLHR